MGKPQHFWGFPDFSGLLWIGSMAERQGFEPWIRFWRILTFQASAFDHSATAPRALEAAALTARKRFRKAAKAGKRRLL